MLSTFWGKGEVCKAHRIRLPDAIIDATALVCNRNLITRSIKDFNKISRLAVVNPFEIFPYHTLFSLFPDRGLIWVENSKVVIIACRQVGHIPYLTARDIGFALLLPIFNP